MREGTLDDLPVPLRLRDALVRAAHEPRRRRAEHHAGPASFADADRLAQHGFRHLLCARAAARRRAGPALRRAAHLHRRRPRRAGRDDCDAARARAARGHRAVHRVDRCTGLARLFAGPGVPDGRCRIADVVSATTVGRHQRDDLARHEHRRRDDGATDRDPVRSFRLAGRAAVDRAAGRAAHRELGLVRARHAERTSAGQPGRACGARCQRPGEARADDARRACGASSPSATCCC